MPENYANGDGIPMGFGMALAKNDKAMTRFAGLTEQQRQQVIAGTHTLRSKQEMEQYVDRLADQNTVM